MSLNISTPEAIENERRSIAMLTPNQTYTMTRADALAVFARLGQLERAEAERTRST